MIFIAPSLDEKYAKGVFEPLVHHSFPFGIASLASVLESDGIEVKIVNDAIKHLDSESIKKLAAQEKGRIVFGITCLTLQVERAKQLQKIIKEALPEAVIIIGGIHATCMPEEFLDVGFDYVFRGEAELVITEIVSCLSQGKDISHISGLAFKDPQGRININPKLKEFVKLNTLPLFPFHLFQEDINHYDLGIVMSSRGCPYECIFCSQRAMTGFSYRARPINMIVDEINIAVNKYQAKYVYFIEDNFVVDRRRAIELCNLLVKSGLHKKAKFMCQLRGDAANPEVLEKLVEAGFETVFLGIETGSERMAKIIKKGETVEDNCKAVYLAKKYGLKVAVTFIVGFPGETSQDREETVRLALQLPLDGLRINIAIPYPGTPLYEMTRNKLRIAKEWKNFNTAGPLVTGPFRALPLPYIPEGATEGELRFLSMWTNMKFWLRPSGIRKFFTISSTGVTRLPSRWYLSFSFLINLTKIAGSTFLLVGWVIILGIKYNVNKFSYRQPKV